MNDSGPRSEERARASVEAERSRLREQLEGLRARCGTDEGPPPQEMLGFTEKVREFVCSTPPELLWPEGVQPPPDGSLFGLLRTPEEWAETNAEKAR